MSLEKRLKTIHRPTEVEEQSASRLKKFFAWLIVLIACFGGIVAFLRMPSIQVTDVEVVGTRALNSDAVAEHAQSHLDGMWIWLVPKTNVLLVSKTLWQEQILSQFPSIKHLSITFKDRTQAIITLEERKPDTIWCDSAPSEQCYFVDRDGVVFEPAAKFSRGVYTIMRGGPLVGVEDPLRKAVFENRIRDYIHSMISELGQSGISVDSVTFRNDGDMEFSFETWNETLVAAASYILVAPSVPPARVTQMLSLVRTDSMFNASFDEHPDKLEYFDFRFANKIMYKFQEDAEITKDRVYEQ